MNVNVTGGDHCLKNDEYRSHKDKDNVVCVYYVSGSKFVTKCYQK